MAPDFVVPFDSLLAIGTELNAVSANVATGDGAAFDVAGLDDPAHEPIRSALDDFRSQWEASVRTLGNNIGALGEISLQIGQTVQQVDAAIAAALAPPTAAATVPSPNFRV